MYKSCRIVNLKSQIATDYFMKKKGQSFGRWQAQTLRSGEMIKKQNGEA